MAISQAVAQAILGQRTPDIMGAFEQGQETAFKRQERDRQEKIRELSGMAAQGDADSLDELTGLAPSIGLALQESLGARDIQATNSLIKDARAGLDLLGRGDTQGFIAFADNRLAALSRMGANTQQTQAIRDMVASGDINGAISRLSALTASVDQAKNMGPTGAMRERDALLEQAKSEDKLIRETAEIALGYRARPVGSAMTTLASGSQEDKAAFTDLTEQVGYSKNKGKLLAEFKLKPEVAKAVQLATLQAKDAADLSIENRSNDKALGVYEASIDTVRSAFDKASTGPIAGWFAAMGANNQMAKASVAMMGPLMKDIFRSAGEGTFTDGDQALLMSMLPSTSDKREAVAFKLEFMDKIIRSKLAEQEQTPKRRVWGQ